MANTQRRMIYSKIWSSQQFGILSKDARLLYIGMITLADDDGRLIGNAAYLRAQVFPYDDKMENNVVKELRNSVETTGLVDCYKVGEFEYIQILKWEEYQVIRGDLYKPSSLPDRNGNVTRSARNRPPRQDKIRQDKIREEIYPFSSFWSLYPKKVGKPKCELKWGKIKDPEREKILAAIPKQKLTDRWKKGFVPDPYTYLNQERWDDDLSAYDDKNKAEPTFTVKKY